MSVITVSTPDPFERPTNVETSEAANGGRDHAPQYDGPPVLRPEEHWALDRSARGSAIHALIGDLLATTRTPSAKAIDAAVAKHPLLEGLSVIHAQKVKLHLATAVSCYFSRFAPCDVWDFAGTDVRIGGCQFDLLWRDSRDGRLLADELKTGLLGYGFGWDRLEAQVARQLRVGRIVLGSHFEGVRAIALAQPWRSFVGRPDGSREPLVWEVV